MSIPRLAAIVVAAALFVAAPPVSATIFAALDDTLSTLRPPSVDEDLSFGLARLDAAKTPPEIAVGKLKSIWRGVWKLGGAKIELQRAKDSRFPYDGATEKMTLTANWVAGNEAVTSAAKHTFRLNVYKLKNDVKTLIASAEKTVEVGGKGLGGTKFKDGTLKSGAISLAAPDLFIVELRATNTNSKDSFKTETWIQFIRK